METITKFAETNRLRIKRDDCGDQIILGKRGFLYFDGGSLCLMATDRRPAQISQWKKLGGNIWMGDISHNSMGLRVQDVKITGITNAKAAMRMAGIRPIRVISDAQRAHLDSIRPA